MPDRLHIKPILALDDFAAFVNDATFTISDALANGATVGTVVFGGQPAPSFAILAGNGTGTGAFAISSAGVITVADATQLDSTVTPSYTLTVQATNTEGSDTASVTVNVTAAGDAPMIVTLQDWSTGSPVEVGSLTLDQDATALTFEDTDMQAAMGTVGIRQSATSIAWGNFEFGAIAFDAGPQCNEDGVNPLYQVLVGFKPINRWAGYPNEATWNQATDEMFPPAFKVLIKKADGTVLHTHQMRDGLPINDPSLNATGPHSSSLGAIRPHVGLGSLLPWQSARPAISPNQPTFFPGMTSEAIRPSAARQEFSSIGAVPVTGNADNVNGYLHWYWADEWPVAAQNGYTGHTGTPSDPYLRTGGSASFAAAIMSGWGYEPGAFGCHDHMTGPGGLRLDRAVLPTPYAILCTDSTYQRPKDLVPIKDLVDAWGKTYFNFPIFYLRNVKTFDMLPNAEIMPTMEWAQKGGYYSGAPDFGVNGTSQQVVVFGATYTGASATTGVVREFNDPAGRFIWNGYSRDYLHSYNTSAWHALLLNSPMHVFASKAFFNEWSLANVGQCRGKRLMQSPTAFGAANYGALFDRKMAWNFLHLVHQWKLATTNPQMGYSRLDVEDWLVTGLELLDTEWRQPIQADTTTPSAVAVNRFGCSCIDNTASGGHAWFNNAKSQVFYMSHVIFTMKKTGCWAAVRAASASAAAALDWIIECMDKYCFDWILAGNGATAALENDGNGDQLGPAVASGTTLTVAHLFADWADHAANNPTTATWDKNSDGTFVTNQRSATQFLRAQYAFMRRDYFSEYANANLTAACSAYQAYIDARKAYIDSQATPDAKTNADHSAFYPSHGVIKAPV